MRCARCEAEIVVQASSTTQYALCTECASRSRRRRVVDLRDRRQLAAAVRQGSDAFFAR
jgi:DNA-directed RNA polymerase subunit RPC12/RpoP